MIEDKKMLLVKVDTLKNIADSLTKSVSSEMFSWCREAMGISGLEKKMTKISCGPLWKENNKWDIVGLCYILSTTNLRSELAG